jgi:hypothetical protein
MTQPAYEYARQLNRQKSMPNTTQSQSSSSVAPVTQSLPFLNNISPLDPLPLIPTAATPMIQLPDGTHIALEDLMELIAAQRFSSPIHLYRQPNPMVPMPIFRHGRDRFPTRELRWHSAAVNNPNRYEALPGTFDERTYAKRWIRTTQHINDPAIREILPERMFAGIHYRIDINPVIWNGRPVRRGDIIIFRGFHSTNIKYIVTWKRTDHISDDIAYVQVNAMGKDQEVVDPSNDDWPALGFFIPIQLCAVTSPPAPTIQYDPLASVTFVNPFTTHEHSPPLHHSSLHLPAEQHNGEVAKSNGFFQRIKRKVSSMSNRSMD